MADEPTDAVYQYKITLTPYQSHLLTQNHFTLFPLFLSFSAPYFYSAPFLFIHKNHRHFVSKQNPRYISLSLWNLLCMWKIRMFLGCVLVHRLCFSLIRNRNFGFFFCVSISSNLQEMDNIGNEMNNLANRAQQLEEDLKDVKASIQNLNVQLYTTTKKELKKATNKALKATERLKDAIELLESLILTEMEDPAQDDGEDGDEMLHHVEDGDDDDNINRSDDESDAANDADN